MPTVCNIYLGKSQYRIRYVRVVLLIGTANQEWYVLILILLVSFNPINLGLRGKFSQGDASSLSHAFINSGKFKAVGPEAAIHLFEISDIKPSARIELSGMYGDNDINMEVNLCIQVLILCLFMLYKCCVIRILSRKACFKMELSGMATIRFQNFTAADNQALPSMWAWYIPSLYYCLGQL